MKPNSEFWSPNTHAIVFWWSQPFFKSKVSSQAVASQNLNESCPNDLGLLASLTGQGPLDLGGALSLCGRGTSLNFESDMIQMLPGLNWRLIRYFTPSMTYLVMGFPIQKPDNWKLQIQTKKCTAGFSRAATQKAVWPSDWRCCPPIEWKVHSLSIVDDPDGWEDSHQFFDK